MDQFDELLHQRAAEESFPLPEDYAGRVFQTCAALDENSRRRQRRHWETWSQQRLRCSSQFQTYPPQLRQRWRRSLAGGVGESGHLPELRLQ